MSSTGGLAGAGGLGGASSAGGAGGLGGAGGAPSTCDQDCSAIQVTQPCVKRWVCNESKGSCEPEFAADGGEYTGAQAAGDCQKIVCAGDLGTRQAVDDDDVPPANACSTYTCSEGKAVPALKDPPGTCEDPTMSCVNGACQKPTGPNCNDGVKNGDEGDKDCGGADDACKRCKVGLSCKNYTDCESDYHCSPIDKVCVPVAGCDDPPQNPSLPPTKCGTLEDGTYCGKCGAGVSCASPEACTRDCASGAYKQDCSGLDCLNFIDIKYKCK